jgi:sigma-B regulation protein RsbU (phosphoserine phosphatase)
MRDDAGNLTHFVSVIKDLTEKLAGFEATAEMQVARRVQQRLYPREIPRIAGVEIAGAAQASLLMCGDYFDYFLVDDDKLGLVVGDVSGHGLGQALIMAETRAWLHSCIQSWIDPSDVMKRLNAPLIKDLSSSQFVTMLLATVDVHNRTLTYANAGHPSGYMFDRSGKTKMVLESTGIPLGVLPEVRGLTHTTIAIEPGDLILLLTDGFLESPRPDGEFIEVEKLLEVVRLHHDAPVQQILDNLFERLRLFVQGETPTDDVTAVICRITDL